MDLQTVTLCCKKNNKGEDYRETAGSVVNKQQGCSLQRNQWCCIKTTKNLTDHTEYISVVKKQRKKASHLYITINIENWLLMQKNNTMCTPRDVISPECVYIAMTCALPEVKHVVLALV